MSRIATLGIDQWNVPDRLSLIEEIWESIDEAEQLSEKDIPEWHKELLAERLVESEQSSSPGATWEEVKARLWRA